MKHQTPPPALNLDPHPYTPDGPKVCPDCDHGHHRCRVCGLPMHNRLHGWGSAA